MPGPQSDTGQLLDVMVEAPRGLTEAEALVFLANGTLPVDWNATADMGDIDPFAEPGTEVVLNQREALELLAGNPDSIVASSDIDDNANVDDEVPEIPNVLFDLRREVDAFKREGKVRGPGPHNLRNYWIRGKGAAKIRWGTSGSMKRCIRQLRKYVVNPGGLCATYHKVATGEWPRGGIVPSMVRDSALIASDEVKCTHAGLAVLAADTGRVLMLQRSVKDLEDPAKGTWEFPGGSIEYTDQDPFEGAAREWSEEIGQELPYGELVSSWLGGGGKYIGFIYVVPSEDDVTLSDGRVVVNPDDPDGDDAEQAAWWKIEDAMHNPALRTECTLAHSPLTWKKLCAARELYCDDVLHDTEVVYDTVAHETGDMTMSTEAAELEDQIHVLSELDLSDDCPPGQHKGPDGECVSSSGATGTPAVLDVTADVQQQPYPQWRGILTVEGVESGDGRMFHAGSLSWDTPPLPLMWQKETSHGGSPTNTSVRVGSVTRIWRENDPSGRSDVQFIYGEGILDTGNPDGLEVHRRMQDSFLRSNSVDVDSIKNADVEHRYAELENGEAPLITGDPELTVFHRGRIRGTTLVEYPAFVEATLSLSGDNVDAIVSDGVLITLGAVPYKKTATSNAAWDGAVNEKRLPSPVPLDVAREVYAWIDTAAAVDGAVPKSACKLPHHNVYSDGTPGAANLTACSAAIAALNGARSGVKLPEADRQAVYNHLARHLEDAGRTPPPLQAATVDLVAATKTLTLTDVPPREWFSEPTDVDMRGALTVTDEGRVYGYLAPKNVRHRSYTQRSVTAPMGRVDYDRFHGRETIVSDGGRVTTGVITMNCGHATTSYSLSPGEAMEHYDNACSIVASIRVGENAQGVWVAGALLPDVEPAQVQRMMSCQLSGDWRAHLDRPGWRELAGALLVPVPGFPMARTSSSVSMSEGELVASSVPVEFVHVEHTTPVVSAHTERVKALRTRMRVSALRARIDD